MFEELGDRLDGVFRRLKSRGVLTQPMLREALREIRRALLEADVNFKVAKKFLKRIEERALGEAVLKSVRRACRSTRGRCWVAARPVGGAADGRHVRGPAGLRKDDHGCKTGPAVE